MQRRGYLALCGTVCGGLAGCSGDSNDTPDGAVAPASDGYPAQSGTPSTERDIDTGSFPTTTVEGVDVPLAPIDATQYWYREGTARFADARGRAQYARSHITGAVLSPAPDGGADDPVSDWPNDDRIVCYCGCPHHLSSLRAATLIKNGYERVFVIDEGFWEWQTRGYPVSGTAVTSRPAVQRIRGRTAADDAGQTAWAWHEPTGQREATPIAEGGSYTLELRFSDVGPDSTIAVETPAYRVEDSLDALTTRTVTGT
ncbi:rhodanese-like domain-containing protein [Haloarcula sp. S1CR25-12]|uniref:Rhodanese-like domain-containing protein n=1 Tax=Haloarcula saliterrae TaxID=2950534 RepID=A0ABU2FG57_9EURY|nr:rhodanese-like domain-containing protein [Haloarcula sp. S1CR25-12]MDS0261217.1 rhodanese-like domain-containing protein [Haloarcula sp. S1CR25-12]